MDGRAIKEFSGPCPPLRQRTVCRERAAWRASPRALNKLRTVTALQQAAERGERRAQVVEGRLFSEGLHVLGAPPGPAAMRAYLEAYFDGALPDEALDAVAAAGGGGGGGGGRAHVRDGGLAAVRARLERLFQQARRGGLAQWLALRRYEGGRWGASLNSSCAEGSARHAQ
jgi:AcrR family transcriptional regulator